MLSDQNLWDFDRKQTVNEDPCGTLRLLTRIEACLTRNAINTLLALTRGVGPLHDISVLTMWHILRLECLDFALIGFKKSI